MSEREMINVFACRSAGETYIFTFADHLKDEAILTALDFADDENLSLTSDDVLKMVNACESANRHGNRRF